MVAIAHAYPMNAQRTCAKCGKPVDPSLLDNLCLQCLVDSTLEDDANLVNSPAAPRLGAAADSTRRSGQTLERVGDYELIEEIARGGMGVVYKARQLSVGRVVALKMILAGQFADEKVIRRFQGEVTAAGMLRHPNIVAVHEIGMNAGQPFFSMDYVEGQNLAELVGNRPLPPKKAARYVKLLAEAIQYAHEQGVLHRDLKPSNVLVESATDEPRLTDFGLAKRLDSESSLTVTGQVLGSPHFMPPEQASPGHGKVGRHSDVYGLGAILYYLLTARAPFQAESLPALAMDVVNTEPIRPRLLNAGVPRDLETICLKCLEKEPSHRYATAQELADELGRFLADEPVHARPISSAGKLSRWCRRKPGLAALASAVILLLLAVVVGTPIANIRISRARAEAEWNLYAADMRLASEALRDGQVDQVRELLQQHVPAKGAPDLRGFEWRYLHHSSDQSGLITHKLQGLKATLVRANPVLMEKAGTLYNFQDETSPPLAWNIATWGRVSLDPPAQTSHVKWWWYPAQQAALAMNEKEHKVAIYRLPNFAPGPVASVPGQPHLAAVSSSLSNLALTVQEPAGRRILLWNFDTGPDFKVLGQDEGTLRHLEFSPNDRALQAVAENGAFKLWSIPEGKALPAPSSHIQGVHPDWYPLPCFDPGSSRVLLNGGHQQQQLQIWDWTTATLSVAYQPAVGGLRAFAFSPDGSRLAAAGSCGAIALVNTQTARQIETIPANNAVVTSLAFDPSGNMLASASQDHTATVWDLRTGMALTTLGNNDDQVNAVVITPDEKFLITQLGNGLIKVYDLQAVLKRGVFVRGPASRTDLAASSYEDVLATHEAAGVIQVWDAKNGRPVTTLQTGETGAVGISFSPKEPLLAWSGNKTIGIFDYRSGRTNTFPVAPIQGAYYAPAFSEDGLELAFADPTNIFILDLGTRTSRKFGKVKNTVVALTYSPNSALLASAHVEGAIILWDRASGNVITNIPDAHPPFAFGVQFSPDGHFLLSGGGDGVGKIWEVTARGLQLLRSLRGQLGWAAMTFSPDGQRILSNDRSNALKLWDTKTGVQVGAIYGYGGRVTGSAFSRDGNTLYSCAQNGDIFVWLAPPLSHGEVSTGTH
jgi:serine/threonine protein kinase/WD40 repeat protein